MKKYLIGLGLLMCMATQAQIRLADPLPKITLANVSGQAVTVSPQAGQYVLIDFWASWCAPCRKKNRALVAWQQTWKAAPLQIVGISVDTDPQKWIKALEKDQIHYQQLNDPKGFDAPTAVLFGVEQLPASYLFDKTGKLIAINPTLEEISNVLNSK